MPLSYPSRTTIVAGALAVSLLAGGAVVPAGTANAAESVSFNDVTSSHWAEKHISKLALQGIITGYNGEFRPSDTVTRQEAVLMALRFAGLEDEVQANDVIAYPSSFVVSSFYKAYIALAFDKGLLDREDEYALAAAETDQDWGTAPASREWVTKLMVKAIGEEDKAESMMYSASSFNDSGSIDSSYLGYVNAAVSMELVNGVTDSKFDPQASVNRASLATMFSRAEDIYPVNYDGQTYGIVTKIDSSSITLYADGEETNYTIGSGTKFYRYDSDKAVSIDDLDLYTDVTVIAQNGTALYIEGKGDEQYKDTYEAVLDRVIESDHMLYAWVDDKPVEVYYDDNLIVQDSNGDEISLDDLKRDSVITITQDTFRSSPVAMSIEVEAGESSGSEEGVFYSADDELITVMQDGSPVSFILADSVQIKIDGLDDPDWNDFIKGQDTVELTLDEDGKVSKVEAVNPDADLISGASVMSYDKDNKLLTLVDGDGTNAYALFLTTNTRVKYNGSALSYSDAVLKLEQGRIVSVAYTGSTIVSMEFLSGYTGTITSINKSDNSLVLELENGSEVTVPYSTPAVEIAGETSADISDLSKGDTVTVKLTSSLDKAASIKVHKSVSYSVIKVMEDENKLQLKPENGDAFRLDVTSVDVLDEDGDAGDITSYSAGDIVNVSYVGLSAESVAEAPVTMGLVSSASASSLTITTNAGRSVVVPFDDDTDTLYADGKSTTSLGSSASGKYAAVYADGENNTVIYISSGETRSFTSYDASMDQIMLLKTSDSSDNFVTVRPDTALKDSSSSFDPASLTYGETLTVYAFRNTAIAIKKN